MHDFIHHDNFHCIYDKIVLSIYIRHLFKHFRIYTAHCSNCQLNEIKKYFTYDKLTPIGTLIIFFYIITMNFVIILSKIKKEFNILLTIICKFIKRILLMSNKNI